MKNDIFHHLRADSLDSVWKKVGIFSRALNRKNSLEYVRRYVRKTVLKAQTAKWNITWYLEGKRVKLSHPQKNIQLLYPVAYEKLINKLHNRQYFWSFKALLKVCVGWPFEFIKVPLDDILSFCRISCNWYSFMSSAYFQSVHWIPPSISLIKMLKSTISKTNPEGHH